MSEPRQIAVVRDQLDLVMALRKRAEELNISREVLDELAGFTSGHASKLLATPPVKGIGPVTLFPLLGALGYAMTLIEDEQRKTRIRRTAKRDKRAVRTANHYRNAKALGTMREMRAKWGSSGGRARFKLLTPEQLREHQSKAAKSRWRAWRRDRAVRAQMKRDALAALNDGALTTSPKSGSVREPSHEPRAAT